MGGGIKCASAFIMRLGGFVTYTQQSFDLVQRKSKSKAENAMYIIRTNDMVRVRFHLSFLEDLRRGVLSMNGWMDGCVLWLWTKAISRSPVGFRVEDFNDVLGRPSIISFRMFLFEWSNKIYDCSWSHLGLIGINQKLESRNYFDWRRFLDDGTEIKMQLI